VSAGETPGSSIVTGSELGPYLITGVVGSGGRGVVYRASDKRLHRDVALKVIRADQCADPRRRGRFDIEARAAAKLAHPNIVSVYDVGEAEGTPYIVSELVSGGTLADRLHRGALTARQTLAMAVPIADALALAHRQGVVHRDLKPGNILLTADDKPKISDFGLAKCFDADTPMNDAPTVPASLTIEGAVLGTPAYMSPEQATGDRIDFRSDLFSFGSILVEMLTGRPPFARGSTAETLAAVLEADVDVAAIARHAPRALTEIICRCLQRDPRDRYGSTDDLLRDLQRVTPETPARTTFRRAAVPALITALVAAVIAAVVLVRPQTPAPSRVSLAVLPFRDVSGDPTLTHFGLGLADALIGRLASVRELTVRPTSAIAPFEAASIAAPEAGRQLHVTHVLEGTVQRRDRSTRVTAQLTDVGSGATIWSETLDLDEGRLFTLEDLVSTRIAEALKLHLGTETRSPASAVVSDDVMRDYLAIRPEMPALMRQAEQVQHHYVERLNAIVARAPSFAPALGTRAYARSILNFFEPSQKSADQTLADADAALALDPTLIEARLARASILNSASGGWRIYDALREHRNLLALAPGSEVAHTEYARVLRHLGYFDQMRRELDTLNRINPHNVEIGRLSAFALLEEGRCGEAIAAFDKLATGETEHYPLWQHRALARIRCSQTSAAVVGELERRIAGSAPDSPEMAVSYALLAVAKTAAGDRNADALEKEALARDQRRGHYHHALIALAERRALLGDVAGTVNYLRRTADAGMPCAICFDRDPLLANVHKTPEYAALIADLRSRDAAYR
jgi:serine/threonine-protein kinase